MDELGIEDLLKDATSKKSVGDFETAIISLKNAYDKIKVTGTDYGVETFLRLPLYLQAANRNDEAWREFNNLIAFGYPNQMTHPDVKPYEESIIYDKMRLFLQREGKNEIAIIFGVYSYLKCIIALHKQRRNSELTYHKQEMKEFILPLLKKAKQDNLIKEYIQIIKSQITELPKIDFSEVKNKLTELQTKNKLL